MHAHSLSATFNVCCVTMQMMQPNKHGWLLYKLMFWLQMCNL